MKDRKRAHDISYRNELYVQAWQQDDIRNRKIAETERTLETNPVKMSKISPVTDTSAPTFKKRSKITFHKKKPTS